MFKYKKILLNLCTILFVLLFIIEIIVYLFTDNNIFGLYYLLLNIVILFFMIPCTYNYKRHYSVARVSKLIIIIVLGIFNSYFLELIILNSINYVDASKIYISKIFIYKSIFKGIVYFLLLLFTLVETKILNFSKLGISHKSID